MIRVFFDHQYKFLGNNIRTFYETLIYNLKLDSEFTIIESVDIKMSKKILREEQYDIFHPTGMDNYFLKMISDKKKMVIFIPDMIDEILHEKVVKEFEDMIYKIVDNKSKQIFLSNKIVFPSKTTENYFWVLYRRYKEYLPDQKFSHINFNIDNLDNGEKLNTKYILIADDRLYPIPYKRFIETLTTISDFLKNNQDIKLVISGYDLTEKEKSFIDELGIIDSILYRDKSKQLYEGALVTIFPSIIDGLNVSVFEAINSNALCLFNSKNPYFKEIIKDNDVLVYDEEVLNDLLQEISTLDKYDRDTLIKNQKNMIPKTDFVAQYKRIFKESLE